MLLITLAKTIQFDSLAPISPFVYSQLFSYTVADWWTDTFGATDDSVIRDKPIVLNVSVDNEDYTKVDSYAECLALQKSWYLSDTAFFVHMDHTVVWEGVITQYGNGTGFSDTGVVYVDNVEYLPLMTSPPSINRAEDIQGYSKLRLIAGSVELANLDGRLDDLKDQSLIGNGAILAYLDNEKVVDGQASSDDVVDQATYFVESAEYGADSVIVELQDLRKLDKTVPTRTLDTTTYPYLSDSNDGAIVPLIYGACRSVKGVAVTSEETGTLAATYRFGELLTSISAVRLKIDDTWTATTAYSADLENGSITVTTARSATGSAPYECQADVVGIAVTYATDIIVDLYERFVDQPFISTFYDLTTWNANKVNVPACGLVIDSATAILDIIPTIQNGVHPTFRFDITPSGKKTIAFDDREKTVTWKVDSLDVLNIDSLRPKDISDYLFTEVVVEYDKDYTEDEYRRITVDTYKRAVFKDYQWDNSTTIETLLTNSTDAQTMADAKALEFSKPARVIEEAILMGDKYFGVQMYDIMQIDTAMGRDEAFTGDFTGREFFGIIIGQVIGLTPDWQNLTMTVSLRLLDRTAEIEDYELWGTTDGDIVSTVSQIVVEV